MDSLSSELQTFLIRLGKEPDCVSERMEHYIKHLLYLLQTDEERILTEYYGLFGHNVKSLEDLASERQLSPAMLEQVIETCLRRIAITPEWQMIKQTIPNQ